jgi:hypothetical protein
VTARIIGAETFAGMASLNLLGRLTDPRPSLDSLLCSVSGLELVLLLRLLWNRRLSRLGLHIFCVFARNYSVLLCRVAVLIVSNIFIFGFEVCAC